jgi:predicted CxxxxCH...CXXCH cytochrome family protein
MAKWTGPVGAAALALAACGEARSLHPRQGPVMAGAVAQCTRCHGDPERVASAATDSLIAAAPPRGLRSEADSTQRAVGAHQKHLRDGDVWKAFPCATCHALPAGLAHPTQRQGKVTLSGLSTTAAWPGKLVFDPPQQAPAWNGALPGQAPTCAATYCHGNFPNGAGAGPIDWTTGIAGCGSCHAIPPPDPHPSVGGDSAGCAECHPSPQTGGKHLDGQLDLAAPGHDASWTDTSSPGFHAFAANQGIAACARCHGAALAGSRFIPGCGACHDRDLPPGVPSWKVNCTMCHGGTDSPGGAPPRATWGHAGDAVRVGAHAAHVGTGPSPAATVNGIARPIDCSACHLKPADALAAGHVDGPTATVTFSGVAASGDGAPAWDRSGPTCSSTYCHGGYSGTFTYLFGGEARTASYSGKRATPAWTGGPATCGSCHGNPPATGYWHSGTHGNGANACEICHPDATGPSGVGTAITDPARHLDGAIDVAPRWRTACYACH